MGIEPTTRDGPAFRRRIVDAEISDVPLANPKATETFLLPHFGHCSFAASCSEIVSVRSKVFSHCSQ